MMVEHYELQRTTSNEGIVTTCAILNCSVCGDRISNHGGPGHGAVCLPCGNVMIGRQFGLKNLLGALQDVLVWYRDQWESEAEFMPTGPLGSCIGEGSVGPLEPTHELLGDGGERARTGLHKLKQWRVERNKS